MASSRETSSGLPDRGPHQTDEEETLAHKAQQLQEELLRVYRAMLDAKRRCGAIRSLSAARRLRLEFDISASGELLPGSPDLAAQLREAAETVAQREAAFPRGHVFCYRCDTFACEHSRPPGPKSVFAGYGQLGEPLWRDLAAVLLDRQDPRVEGLYRQPPTTVTLVESGRSLTAQQLGVYGKRSERYRLLGQVVLGYLPLQPHGDSEPTPVALTLQAVRTGRGATSAALNVLGTLRCGTPAHETLEARPDPRVADALRAASEKLRDLELLRVPRRRRAATLEHNGLGILQNLSRNLERIFRQRRRRTHHSRTRHQDRRRPTASAFRDALQASRQAIYRDVEQRTWVVIGPRNRVHIFNDDGMHVTSVVYQGETIRQRTTRGKWLTPRTADLASFQSALQRHAGGA